MISRCVAADAQRILEVINSAAIAYRDVIPNDCWHDPYMSIDELHAELESGVLFIGHREEGRLMGVMGSQDVDHVTLIRHAYVLPEAQGRGLGHSLLSYILAATTRPVLVGTWSSATWAIRFYERNGFTLTSTHETRRLLGCYWSVNERQMEGSSVLVGPGVASPVE